jgi:hypothetical protein
LLVIAAGAIVDFFICLQSVELGRLVEISF